MKIVKMTIEELLESPYRLVCFGSGKAFDKLLEIFEDTFLPSKISYIVENNTAKWEHTKSVNNREIPIVSPEYFVSQDKRDILALISLKNKEEILEQYKNVDDCTALEAVYYKDIMAEYCTRRFDAVELPVTLRRAEKMIIPKIIHYFWFGKCNIPKENLKWMESWKKYCPDYEIIQWNEDNYDVTKNKYMMEAYQARKWGFATDYARLDVIYQHGGIYLDTDVELIKSLDELLYQPAFMGWGDDLRVSTGLGFGTVKGNILVKEMRDYYDNIHFIKEDDTYDLTACPTFQTRVLQRHGLKKDGEYQVIEDMAILPVTYLSGIPSYILHGTRTEHTIGLHQFQGSWKSTDRQNECKFFSKNCV